MFKKIKDYLFMIDPKGIIFALLGSAIIAFGTYNINANSDIPQGGIIGICLIIEFYTGISPALSNLVINALCCVLAWRIMGTLYMLNAAVAALGFSAFYAIFEAFPPIIPVMSDYPLLAAVIGAVFVEVGTGISLRYGAAPSGEHALSMAISKRGGLDFEWLDFSRDFIVIFASLCYADPYSVVYALMIITATTPLREYIINAPKKAKVAKRTASTKKSWLPKVIIGLVIIALLVGGILYVNDYYHADKNAINNYHVSGVETVKLDDGITAYVPEGEVKSGFIFYPGGKVEYTAYEPLLSACASRGVLCVAVEMPMNLAVFGINSALDIPEYFPEIEHWYVGGHSLGGSMAAFCAGNNTDVFDGVVLLGAYSVTDISELRVLSVYGSNDGVMNRSKYDQYTENLPENYEEHVIVGGCHAYFGMYGKQDGDGEPTISNEAQIIATADYIVEFILGTK